MLTVNPDGLPGSVILWSRVIEISSFFDGWFTVKTREPELNTGLATSKRSDVGTSIGSDIVAPRGETTKIFALQVSTQAEVIGNSISVTPFLLIKNYSQRKQ